MKKRETDDSYEDQDGDDDYDYEDEEDLQVLSADLACPLDQDQTKKDNLNKTYILILKYCPNACGRTSDANNPMCIRTCSCPNNFVLDKDGKCVKMPQTIKDKINKNEEVIREGRSQRKEGILFCNYCKIITFPVCLVRVVKAFEIIFYYIFSVWTWP